MKVRYLPNRQATAHSAVVVVTSAFLLTAASAGRVTIADLVSSAESLHGSQVVLTGEVKEINYRPQVVEGVSIYSFQLDDGSGEIRVLSQLASLFSPGDKVRLEGVFLPADEQSARPAQIDATEGAIEVLEAAESELAKMFNQDPARLMSVPVAPVETGWSRADQLASVFSAAFALVAVTALVLRMRRFNVGLSAAVVASDWAVGRSDSLRLVVRIVPVGSLPPLLAQRAELRVRGLGRVKACRVAATATDRAEVSAFPLLVSDAVLLDLTFSRIRQQDLADAKAKLILHDALCRKSHRQRIRLATNRPFTLADIQPLAKNRERSHRPPLHRDLAQPAATSRISHLPRLLRTIQRSDALLLVALGLLVLLFMQWAADRGDETET